MDWWNTQDAWQWPVQFFVVGRASVSMTLAAVCFGVWASFLAPLGNGLGI